MNKKDNPKISLIIPFYNVEPYIRKCLDSVHNQTFRDFEVIMIDDGSTDRSLQIAEEFACKNNNITLISRENKGISETRNEAIGKACGEYIAFLDSDDFLDPDFLNLLYTEATLKGADISCCNYNLYYPKNNKTLFMFFRAKYGVYSKDRALKSLLLDISFHSFLWNKLVKRSLFFKYNISFCNRYFEDISTLPKLFYYANKIAVIDKPLYYYTSRRDSILGNASSQKINDLILSVGLVKEFLIQMPDYNKYKLHLWLLGERIKFVSAFFIIQMHIQQLKNPHGLLKNLQSTWRSVNFFLSKNFKKVDHTNAVPFMVKSPKG